MRLKRTVTAALRDGTTVLTDLQAALNASEAEAKLYRAMLAQAAAENERLRRLLPWAPSAYKETA